MVKAFGAFGLALALGCSHGPSIPSAATSPSVGKPRAAGTPPDFRATPSSPDLSNRPLLGVKTRVIGPKHPVLIRHQGQHPIVYLDGFYPDRRPGAPVWVEQPRFELAVFEDGVLAFQGYPCGWGSSPTTTNLSEPGLAALRALVGEQCFQLPKSNVQCSDGGFVHVRCAAGSRTIDVSSSCEGHKDTQAWREFASNVRRLLRIDDRPPDSGVCAACADSIGRSEIDLTISPWVIVDSSYGPEQR